MKIAFFSDEVLERIKDRILEDRKTVPNTAIIIDLETFGKGVDTAVFNIAALFFSLDPAKQEEIEKEVPNNTLEFRFDIIHQLALGRVADHSTLEWWQQENKRAALEAISKLEISDFKESMNQIYTWIRELKDKYNCRVYYRGMDFDGPILDSLYESAGIKTEWRRGDAARDIRSFVDAKLGVHSGHVYGIPKEERSVSHTALGDCYNDARQMQVAYYLNNLGF